MDVKYCLFNNQKLNIGIHFSAILFI